jgi:methionine-rich copper-binding protein CopC
MLQRFCIALLLMCGLSVTAADAHPRLTTANPASGAVLKVAPKEIRLRFSEGLIATFTGLDLKDDGGHVVPTGKAALAGADNRQLVVPIASRLSPGNYTVNWHAVSVDTHRVTGSYGFKVAR